MADTLDEVMNQKVTFYMGEVHALEKDLDRIQNLLAKAIWHLDYWEKERKNFLEEKTKTKKIGFNVGDK